MGFKPNESYSLEEVSLNQAELDKVKQAKERPTQDEAGRPLFLSKGELLQASDSNELLRVIIEPDGEPVIVSATSH